MDPRWPPVELRIETYERLPPVVTGDTPVVTGGLQWVSSTGTLDAGLQHVNSSSSLNYCLKVYTQRY